MPGYRVPAEINGHALWLHFRFSLSLRMVNELLAVRGIVRQAPGLASPQSATIVPFPAAKAGCCPDGLAAGTPSANGLKLAAAYARVSLNKREEEQTIDSQVDAVRRAAEERGWQLLPDLICTDDGRSGATLARPGLDRLRDLIAEGTCAAVLVCFPDRLARNYAYHVLVIWTADECRAAVIRYLVRWRGAATTFSRTCAEGGSWPMVMPSCTSRDAVIVRFARGDWNPGRLSHDHSWPA